MLKLLWRFFFPPPRDPEDGTVLLMHLAAVRETDGLSRLTLDRELADLADHAALRIFAGIAVNHDTIIRSLIRTGRPGWVLLVSAQTDASPELLASWWHTFTDSGPAAACSYAGVSRRGDCWVMIISEN